MANNLDFEGALSLLATRRDANFLEGIQVDDNNIPGGKSIIIVTRDDQYYVVDLSNIVSSGDSRRSKVPVLD